MEAPEQGGGRGRALSAAVLAGMAGLGLSGAGLARLVEPSAAFFGAGAMLLAALLCALWLWLSGRGTALVSGIGRLGFRFASVRPGRSVLCIATIASATFLIVSLDAFRRTGGGAGTGGFPLLAESALPVVHNPDTPAGREALNLPAMDGVRFVPFRLKPGDDASCLNLYRPRNPRVLASPADFLRAARFEFQDAMEKPVNPWLLLETPSAGGAIPAIADANSMAYALHVKLGEEFTVEGKRFRIVAALRDSIFQGELLISEANFVRAFPEYEGFRFFLVDAPPGKAAETAAALEGALADYGFDATGTAERLASFHRVENTYLSTFQALGALGLALGTVGLAAVILRNVLERRRQLAMLRAVGYRAGHLRRMTLAENVLLVGMGLGTGAICALVAIAPAVAERGGRLPSATLAVLLAAVLASGLAAAMAGTAAALRSPLVETLKSE
jgi:hypothetical protein